MVCHRWGWDWYVGPPAPLSHWNWKPAGSTSTAGDGSHDRRERVGENGNGEPSPVVDALCRLNGTDAPAAGRPVRRRRGRQPSASACSRFPLECFGGIPHVKPGCALVRPLPSTRGCGGPQRAPCQRPRIRMSHAWPLAAETSPNALTIDPSINTFLSMPSAPEQLQRHHPRASALRFVVLLREPLARSMSSARMMREWGWDKHANVSSALLDDLARLGGCAELVAPASKFTRLALDGSSGLEGHRDPWRRAADELAKASDRSLRRFRECLAHKAPLNHVRGSVYAAGVLGWLSAGFAPSAFLWLETESVRAMGAYKLLAVLAKFAGLPTEHLRTLPENIRAACEGSNGGGAGTGGAHGPARLGRRLASPDSRRQTHAMRALPPEVARPLQDAFRPFNELLRTLVADIAPTLHGVPWLS